MMETAPTEAQAIVSAMPIVATLAIGLLAQILVIINMSRTHRKDIEANAVRQAEQAAKLDTVCRDLADCRADIKGILATVNKLVTDSAVLAEHQKSLWSKYDSLKLWGTEVKAS